MNDPLLQPRNERALKLISHPQDQYPSGTNPFWWLWTAKEAIFKAHRELKVFNPAEIKIAISEQNQQLFIHSDGLSGRIYIKESLIYSVVAEDINAVYFQVGALPKGTPESGAVRLQLTQFCQKKLLIDTKVMKDEYGLPVLSYQNTPVSFSHHAGYGGFCIPRTR